MSDNPFASPTQAPPQKPKKQLTDQPTAPTATTVFTIICLVLGIIGLFAVCMGFVGLFMNEFVSQMTIDGLPEDDPNRIMQEKMQVAQQGMLIPNIVIQVLSLFVASMLVIGASMVLMRKVAGPGLLEKACLIAIGFNLIRLIATIVMQLQLKPVMADAMGAGPAGEAAAEMFEIMFVLGIVVGAVIGIGMMIFYFFAYRNLVSQSARNYFATFSEAET